MSCGFFYDPFKWADNYESEEEYMEELENDKERSSKDRTDTEFADGWTK